MIHMPKVWFRYVKPIQTNLKTIEIQHTDLCKRIAAWSNQMIGGWDEDSDAVHEMTDICWHTGHHYNTDTQHGGTDTKVLYCTVDHYTSSV